MPNKILVIENTHVIPGEGYGKSVKGLGDLTTDVHYFLKKPKEFKLVLFVGGEDVDPSLYGESSPLDMCASNLKRDRSEKVIFKHALNNNISMIGICRGFQFLNVMAKGRLMHHINRHAGSVHSFDSYSLKKPIDVNSFHHQMVIPHKDSHVIGWPVDNISNVYYGKDDQSTEWNNPEVEAAIFPEVNACGVQYHPEWLAESSEAFSFFYNLAKNLINLSMNDFIDLYTINLYTKRYESGKQKPNVICARHSDITR